MTKLARIAIVAAAALVSAPAAFAQAPKLAFINSQKILAEAPGRSEAEATYNRETDSARGQLQRMDDSLKAMVAAYEKDAPGLDSARRASRGQAIREREASYQQRAQDLNTQMQQRQADLARPLLEQVSKVLEDIRTQGNYTMIFDVGAGSNVLVAADKSLDLSDQVLARLKQLGPPKAAAAPAATTPTTNGPATKPAGISRPKP